MGSRNILFFVTLASVFYVRVVFTAFIPVDNILVSCGSKQMLKHSDGRTFIPDLRNSIMHLSPNSDIVVSDSKGQLSLYKSARVFTGPSTYSISVKGIGRHWLRLHFCPIENSQTQYHLKDAVFSVFANEVLLLQEFSFDNLAKDSQMHILKEYVVEVSDSSLKVSLTLSPLKSSIAFINGIEVISVPDDQLPLSAIPIPLGSDVHIPSHIAFETTYRVNMGGSVSSLGKDTLWRIWELDHRFLINPGSARNVSVETSLVKYPKGVSVEIAPNWVYSTAQEMANANIGEPKFNVSWVFDVDHSFTYLIRMHFCDIVSEGLHNLVFNVYINNQSAVNSFDISSKTNGLLKSYYVDFLTNVSSSSEKIFIQIGPPNMRNFAPNAILNGLEIMKLSSFNDRLNGFYRQNFDPKEHRKNKLVMFVIVSSVAGLVLVLVIVVVFCFCRRCEKKPKDDAWLPLPSHMGNSESKISNGSSRASTSPSMGLGRVLTFSEVREATNNFDETQVLGVGGFGKVYRGVLDNGLVVAVKRGNPRSQQGLVEFKTEIQVFSKLRHRHLVSLIGYCEELNEMILVYEYMSGGPLRKHLYGSNSPSVPWKQRLHICIGAAKGLHYLHTGASECIIHRDVKSANILLDEELTAKVADFGLSKLGPTMDETHVSTAVKGSFGYLDPDYYRRQKLTEKSDVYSFGVVLMEVLCARPAVNPSLPREQINIAEWAMSWLKKGRLEQIIDPTLKGSVNLNSLRKYGETAEKCLAEFGTDRPNMGDVLWNLEYALQLQEASIESLVDENSTTYIPDIPDWLPDVESGDIADVVKSDTVTSGVFSQIIYPKGR